MRRKKNEDEDYEKNEKNHEEKRFEGRSPANLSGDSLESGCLLVASKFLKE